jgi:hypothetical protein
VIVLALLGCTPDAPTPPAVEPTEAPAAPTAEAAPHVPTTIWTAKNIRDLVPVAPAHNNAVPKPIPTLPAYDTALATLGEVIDTYDGDPENPWAVAHGILARGKDFRLSDGREAIPHLFGAFAEPRTAGDYTLVGFPTALGKVRVEPHTDLLLKNLAEVGVDPTATFTTRAGTVAVADLYRWTVLKTFLVPKNNHSSFTDPGDISWNVQALANWAPGELQWIADDGTPMDLDDLVSFDVAVLLQESAFMLQDMQRGQDFQRAGQPLFSYPCGGSHLVQGVSYAVARGYGTPKDRKVVEGQVPLLFYRLPIELGIYDVALRQHANYRMKLQVQRMKFLGHWLETVSKMHAMGLFVPDANQLTQIEGAAQNLALTVDSLQKQGAFDHLPALRVKDEQMYLDIIGDSGHAVRGLELALGRGKVIW